MEKMTKSEQKREKAFLKHYNPNQYSVSKDVKETLYDVRELQRNTWKDFVKFTSAYNEAVYQQEPNEFWGNLTQLETLEMYHTFLEGFVTVLNEKDNELPTEPKPKKSDFFAKKSKANKTPIGFQLKNLNK